ncbi:hypothetical protein LSP04_16080 [Levilactobacillus spicheri]|uniref:Transposase DDE domain-containing protein n=1 Tax=Levilactobacillus spicheri TaxID=216463 RepID=A0ABQ0WQP3_9LACO|nr:hypothetical protein LSP04_16080 [Levilactobacillus spicheri]
MRWKATIQFGEPVTLAPKIRQIYGFFVRLSGDYSAAIDRQLTPVDRAFCKCSLAGEMLKFLTVMAVYNLSDLRAIYIVGLTIVRMLL